MVLNVNVSGHDLERWFGRFRWYQWIAGIALLLLLFGIGAYALGWRPFWKMTAMPTTIVNVEQGTLINEATHGGVIQYGNGAIQVTSYGSTSPGIDFTPRSAIIHD